jgi:hypothetical protein
MASAVKLLTANSAKNSQSTQRRSRYRAFAL